VTVITGDEDSAVIVFNILEYSACTEVVDALSCVVQKRI